MAPPPFCPSERGSPPRAPVALAAGLPLRAVAAELGAVAPVALLLAAVAAMAAAPAVAPAGPLPVAEGLAAGLTAGLARRGHLGWLLAAEEALQPSEEPSGSRRRGPCG